jgi:anthrone oxygenase-like protein
MIIVLETLAVASAGLFTAWALYVSLVEHPARMATGPAAARTEFRPSYRRAAPWQASFAILAFGSALAASLATSAWAWAIGGVMIGAAVPFTLLVIMPTNRRLLASAPLDDREAGALLQRWGRLHWIRSGLGAVGLVVLLLAAHLR